MEVLKYHGHLLKDTHGFKLSYGKNSLIGNICREQSHKQWYFITHFVCNKDKQGHFMIKILITVFTFVFTLSKGDV